MRFLAYLTALLLFLAPAPAAQAETVGTVNFDFDSASLDADALSRISQIADQLKARSSYKPTVVVGFTDAVGASGYNDGLGQRRAEAVARALVAEGVPVARIGTVESRGERELLVAVATPERANRRVTVTLGDLLAACQSYRDIPLTAASVGTELQSDLTSRLQTAVGAYQRFSADGLNGPAFQMAGAAREDCGIAVGLDAGSLRKVEYAQKCFCNSARLDVALGR